MALSNPNSIISSAASLYRNNISAADLLAAPVLTTPTTSAGGSLTNVTHNCYVIAGNKYGRTVRSNLASANPGASGQFRINFTSLPAGYEFIDIYLGTVADPLFVGRATSGQVTAGDTLTAAATSSTLATFSGSGTAGTITVRVVGTGLASSAQLENTAFSIPGVVSSAGKAFLDFDVRISTTGDFVVPNAAIIPFFQDSDDTFFYQGNEEILIYGGSVLGQRNSNLQRIRVNTRDSSSVALVISQLSGTGATISIRNLGS